MSGFADQNEADAHFRTNFNTELSPEDTFKYHVWLDDEGSRRGKDMREEANDYDMQGAWKDGAGQSGNGHYPDTYKKPNHPTFSDQSKYHDTEDTIHGGKWEGGHWGEGEYTPSQKMLDTTHPVEWLKSYMRTTEPDQKLVLPE